MSKKIEEKFNMIRDREESFAYLLAKRLIDKPNASVWIIFLPILLVYHLQRIQKYKASIKSFADGIMKSKIITLEATMEEVKTGIFPRERLTAGLNAPPADEKTLVLRHKKMEEIELLRQHFLLLLHSSGNSYQQLLRNAYPTAGDYRHFLNRLHKAEKEVNEAVIEASHPTPEAREVVARMEDASESLREAELAEVFK